MSFKIDLKLVRDIFTFISLQNLYSFPHVEVHKVNPEVGARQHLPPAALHWTLHQSGRLMEGDPIYPVVWGGGV